MIEVYGNFWDIEADAKCITTNGFVKKNGEGVMGRGIAKQAANRFPNLPAAVGWQLQMKGNHVANVLGILDVDYITFPVKHNWWEKADFALIKRSAEELVVMADSYRGVWNRILLPRPGCGNGGLRWDDVQPILEPILDDRFMIVSLTR